MNQRQLLNNRTKTSIKQRTFGLLCYVRVQRAIKRLHRGKKVAHSVSIYFASFPFHLYSFPFIIYLKGINFRGNLFSRIFSQKFRGKKRNIFSRIRLVKRILQEVTEQQEILREFIIAD